MTELDIIHGGTVWTEWDIQSVLTELENKKVSCIPLVTGELLVVRGDISMAIKGE